MILSQALANKINRLIELHIYFALFRLPEEDVITVLIQNEGEIAQLSSINELDDKRGFVFMPFSITKKSPLICIKPDLMMPLDQLSDELIDTLTPRRAFGLDGSEERMSKSDYFNTSSLFLQALKRQDVEKLVLSRSVNYPKPANFSVGKTFCNACNLYSQAYVCLCSTPQIGTWLGCSPELLLAADTTMGKTVALAGTKKDNAGVDWDEKNIKEQGIVSVYIREQLHSLGINFAESERVVVNAGDLLHLKTEFEFDLKEKAQVTQVLDKLHPTPAVCGFPKEKAYRFILEHEAADRLYYSGFWGYFDPSQKTELFVNLRCMKIESSGLCLFAGGGLLSTSDAETEWLETEEKLRTMKNIIE